MPAPTYVASGGVSKGGIASWTLGLPAGVAEGDLLISVVGYNGTDALSYPTGWAIVGAHTGGSQRLYVLWKRAVAGEAGAAMSKASGSPTAARMHAYRGARSAGDPWEVAPTLRSGTSTAWLGTGVTTASAENLLLHAVGGVVDANSSTQLSGWSSTATGAMTEVGDDFTNSGAGYGVGLAHGVVPTATATGDPTVTAPSAAYLAVTVAVAPPAPLALTRDAAETLPIASDTATGARLYVATAAESLVVTDDATRLQVTSRTVGETGATADTTTGSTAQSRATSDGGALTDTAQGAPNQVRSGSEAVSLTDTATRTLTSVRGGSEAVVAGDATGTTSARTRTASDVLPLGSDSATSNHSASRAAATGVVVVDSADGRTAWARTAAESAAVTDAATRTLAAPRSGPDGGPTTDTATVRQTSTRPAGEAVLALDTAQGAGGTGTRFATESLPSTEGAERATALLARTVADATGATDLAIRALGQARAGTETLSPLSTGNSFVLMSRAGGEGGTVVEAGGVGKLLARSGPESVVASDSAGRAALLVARGAFDLAPAADVGEGTSRDALSGTVLVYLDGVWRRRQVRVWDGEAWVIRRIFYRGSVEGWAPA